MGKTLKKRPPSKPKPLKSKVLSRPKPKLLAPRHEAAHAAPAMVSAAVEKRELRREVGGVVVHPHLREQAKNWVSAMLDPFDSVPRPLGSSVGSTTVTISTTASLATTQADSYVIAFALPRKASTSFLYLNFAPAAGSSPVAGNWTTASQASVFGSSAMDLMLQARPLATGVRLYTQLSANDRPGMFAGGMYPMADNFPFLSTNLVGWLNMSTTVKGTAINRDGVSSATSVWKPLDSQDGEFAPEECSSATTYRTTNVPYIIAYGWPVGTTFTLDMISHRESIQSSGSAVFSKVHQSMGDDDWSSVWDYAMLAFNSKLAQNLLRIGIHGILQSAWQTFNTRPSRDYVTGGVDGRDYDPSSQPHGDELSGDPPDYRMWVCTRTALERVRNEEREISSRLRALESVLARLGLSPEESTSVSKPSFQSDVNHSASLVGPSSVPSHSIISRDDSMASLPDEKTPNQAKLVDGRWFIPAAFGK